MDGVAHLHSGAREVTREMLEAYDKMADRSVLIYNRLNGAVHVDDMARFRWELIEAMTGEDIERRSRRCGNYRK